MTCQLGHNDPLRSGEVHNCQGYDTHETQTCLGNTKGNKQMLSLWRQEHDDSLSDDLTPLSLFIFSSVSNVSVPRVSIEFVGKKIKGWVHVYISIVILFISQQLKHSSKKKFGFQIRKK